MSKKAFVFSLICGMFLGGLLFYVDEIVVQSKQIVDNYRELFREEPALNVEEITLYEAWDIAYNYAQKWSPDAKLVSLESNDVGDVSIHQKDKDKARQIGHDGRRASWLAFFTSPSVNKQLSVRIITGKVVSASEDGIHDTFLPTLTTKPIIDSPEMMKRVKESYPQFEGEDGKGTGYRFMAHGDNGILMAKVAGAVSVKGSLKTAIITFNQKDGQLLDAQYFTDEGGARKWQDF